MAITSFRLVSPSSIFMLVRKMPQETIHPDVDVDVDAELQQGRRKGRRRLPRQDLRCFKYREEYILVRQLPLYTTERNVRDLFMRYGVVEKVHFKHRRDLIYTLTCTVRMESMQVVNEIMEVQNQHEMDAEVLGHVINGFTVKVERYYGKRYHLDIYKRGEYKLPVVGFHITRGRLMQQHFESLFWNCKYSGIQFRKNEDNRYTGEAEIRFKDALSKLRGIEIAVSLEWDVSVPRHTKADCTRV